MPKTLLLLLPLMLLVASCTVPAPTAPARPTTTDQPVNESTANTNAGGSQGGGICRNQCGDGTCQAIVCLATGCPCAETIESCPADCT